MPATQTVIMPDGTEIQDVPVGMTKAELMVRYNKLWSPDPEASVGDVPPDPSTPTVQPESPSFLKENMDIPGGIAGAIAGGKALGRGGPTMGAIGAVTGGAIGTFGGELLSDDLMGVPLDYANAAKSAAMSIGMDLALFGGARTVKLLKSLWQRGVTPKDAALEILQRARPGAQAGSEESLRATQAELQRQGATLTPSQTGRAGLFKRIAEGLSESAILSQGAFQKNAEKVNKVVSDGLHELMGNKDIPPSLLGEDMYRVIDSGRKSLYKVYGDALEAIQGKLGPTQRANVRPLIAFLNTQVEAAQRSFGNTLPPELKSFVAEAQNRLAMADGKMSARELIDFEKWMIQSTDGLAYGNNGVFNSTVDRQVTELIGGFKNVIGRSLNAANGEAGTAYRTLNANYSKAMDNLLPEINASLLKQGNISNYDQLGQLMFTKGSTSKIKEMLRSLDTAYAVALRAGDDIPYSASEIKERIRQGYLQTMFPSVGDEFDIRNFATLADRFSSPREAERLKLIMGDKYSVVKQYLNMMKEASQSSSSSFGELMLKAKEWHAIEAGAIGAGTLVASDEGTLAGVGTAATILMTPVVISSMLLNPKHINKMLTFGSTKFRTKEAMAIAAKNLAADIIYEMSFEDQAALKEQMGQ